MKKRVLSFLLVLCMLLTAMPVFTFGSGAAENSDDLTKNENSKAVSSFYDYYVTDGLVAFFDAFDTESDVLDLENGKWYAKIYNASTGAFEKTTDEGFTATIGGGLLGAEIPPAEEGGEPTVNETGWVKDEKGFSYFTNKSVGANKISLPLSLIANDMYTVEFVGRVDLREVRDAKQESGDVTTATEDGKTTYTISGLTVLTYNNGAAYSTQHAFYTLTLKGEANETVDLVVNDAPVRVTLDEEGNGSYMAACASKLDTYTIVAPESVELTFSKDMTLNNPLQSSAAFVFGTLHGLHWTNRLGDNNWGNCKGKSRWYTGSADWGSHNGNKDNAAYGGSYSDSSMFVSNNGQAQLMRVEAVKSSSNESYSVSYGGTSVSVSGNKHFADYKFDLLSNTCGAAYAVRIYSRHLNTDEEKLNAFADKMLLNGVDFDTFNALSDSLKEMYIKSTESLALDAGTQAFTEALDGVLDFAEKEAAMRALSDYDKLYVGADGEDTANGGSLVALFSAYGDNTESVDFANRSWRAKVGNADIALQGAIYNEENKSGFWKLREDGGLGYDLNFDETGKNGTYSSASGVYLQLEPSLISSPDFTVEYSIAYEYFTLLDGSIYNVNKSITYNETPTETIGILKNMSCRTGGFNSGDANRILRWYVARPSVGWQQAGMNSQMWGDTSRITDAIFVQTITRDESDSEGVKSAVYTVLKDSAVKNTGTYSAANVTNGTIYYTGSDVAGQTFQLFRQVPVSVYAIRVYDTVLTTAETQYNRFIDLAAYCGADLTAFLALAPESRAIATSMLSGNVFTMDTTAFADNLKAVTDVLGNDMDIANSLYVTDGLSMLLTAYAGFNTGAIGGGETPVSWFNGVKQGSFAQLRGKGWTLSENGGFTITRTWETFNQDRTFGLYLDQTLLPQGSYTVELVANPVGITNPDGTRYIDDHSTYGQNFDNGFAIGPLRALQFVCYRPTGKDGQMEKRWIYQKEVGAWQASGFKARFQDTSWKALGLEQILTYTISLELSDGNASTYSFYSYHFCAAAAAYILWLFGYLKFRYFRYICYRCNI